ncbi:hypothetical protein [Flocculibacter collagenilyticus]|uniref:hypothetical protein n=1 Tax=Flocculibacter collagenilyticus TaxID=2744479 RepID=UPI0018F6F9BE|nr:hypothetical protein [Flocculibacter collagenilyticus]
MKFYCVVAVCCSLLLISVVTPNVNATPHAFWALQDDEPNFNVTLGSIYNSNINPTLLQEQSDFGFQFNADLNLVHLSEGYAWQALYKGNIARYQDRADTQYQSHHLKLGSAFFVNDKFHFILSGELTQRDELLGQGISKQKKQVIKPDQYVMPTLTLSGVYGSINDKQYLTVNSLIQSKRYEEHNLYASQFDHDRASIDVELGIAVSDATHIVGFSELSHTNYIDDTRDDSDMKRVLLGARWQATGVTSVKALLGAYQRDFSRQATQKGTSWLAALNWQPYDYMSIEFHSEQTSLLSELEQAGNNQSHELGVTVTYVPNDDWTLVGQHVKRTEQVEGETVQFNTDYQLTRFSMFKKVMQHSQLSLQFSAVDEQDNRGLFHYQQDQVKLNYHLSF